MKASIQQLKKVHLSLLAESEPSDRSSSSPVSFSFLYGIASAGICPFESALYDKCPGDTLHFTVSEAEAPEFFSHLLGPLQRALALHKMPERFTLQVEVSSVADADNREVVKALAMSVGHGGCGGSCDCGCS